MSIRVVNMKTYKKQDDEVVFLVDRSSVLGNPYFITGVNDRKLVIDMYKYDIFLPIVNRQQPVSFKFKDNATLQDKFREEINTIYKISKSKDIVLGCHCKPLKCHADIIKEFVENMSKEV